MRSAPSRPYPDNLKDVGFFALPGDDASKNGVTAWEPAAIYIPKATKHLEDAKKFVASSLQRRLRLQTKAVGAPDPTCQGLQAAGRRAARGRRPAHLLQGGATAPALEFLSPVKGPSLEQITVEVGSGIRTPADGAALYDEDVRKQAQQLGLPGWK